MTTKKDVDQNSSDSDVETTTENTEDETVETEDSVDETETSEEEETESDEGEESETEEDEESDEDESDVDWKARAQKAEKLAKNYKIRAEKAEKKTKGNKPQGSSQQSQNLSLKDSMALINAKVHEDDVDDVVKYAKFEKISVAQALKSPIVRTLLADKVEKRKTAQATHTGSARRTTTKATDDSILDAARTKGELPESEEDYGKMFRARKGLNKK